jgi:hypothetical protein
VTVAALSGGRGLFHVRSRIAHHGRRKKYAGTYSVDRKLLTVSTTYGRKTREVDARVQHQALAHQLLEQLVKEGPRRLNNLMV